MLDAFGRLICSQCNARMRLSTPVPDLIGKPESTVMFVCDGCGHSRTITISQQPKLDRSRAA